MPYQIVCDGRLVDLDNVQYLLSPQDLAAYDLIPRLIELGVASLKIEGRLKTAEYVANITRHYRDGDRRGLGRSARRVHAPRRPGDAALVLARLLPRLPGRQQPQGPGARRLRQEAGHPARRAWNRSTGAGVRLSVVGPGQAGRRPGLRRRRIGPAAPSRGAASTRSSPRPERQPRTGAPTPSRGDRVASSSGSVAATIDLRALEVGQRVWKTDDPELTRRLRRSFEGPPAPQGRARPRGRRRRRASRSGSRERRRPGCGRRSNRPSRWRRPRRGPPTSTCSRPSSAGWAARSISFAAWRRRSRAGRWCR